MTKYIGGDIQEIVCKHSLGTLRFQAKSDEDFTINPGGFRSADDENAITGAGEFIDKINRVRSSIEGTIAVDFNSENETKNLPLLAASPELGVWTITHISGVVWKGKGKPVGDLNANSNSASMPLKIACSGIIEKI